MVSDDFFLRKYYKIIYISLFFLLIFVAFVTLVSASYNITTCKDSGYYLATESICCPIGSVYVGFDKCCPKDHPQLSEDHSKCLLKGVECEINSDCGYDESVFNSGGITSICTREKKCTPFQCPSLPYLPNNVTEQCDGQKLQVCQNYLIILKGFVSGKCGYSNDTFIIQDSGYSKIGNTFQFYLQSFLIWVSDFFKGFGLGSLVPESVNSLEAHNE